MERERAQTHHETALTACSEGSDGAEQHRWQLERRTTAHDLAELKVADEREVGFSSSSSAFSSSQRAPPNKQPAPTHTRSPFPHRLQPHFSTSSSARARRRPVVGRKGKHTISRRCLRSTVPSSPVILCSCSPSPCAVRKPTFSSSAKEEKRATWVNATKWTNALLPAVR